ncbi:MAG: hypothetical protein J3K34DRAFT_27974 [Monoraphidium minutum]|nr:MAG: hypothetical protein J3K34DRAFT_27974 [Monoraphidium minutum]
MVPASVRRRRPAAPLALAAAIALLLAGAAAAADGGSGGKSGGGGGGGKGSGADGAGADWKPASRDKARAAGAAMWHKQLHQTAQIVVNGQRMGDLLGPVLKHTYELPPTQVQRSLVYLGPNARLRRVVHDLIVGRPVRVGAVGGSITHGAKASKIGETDWFSLVGRYLKDAFPRSNVTARNGALPATPSALMNMCLETYIDADVDLLFVEYVANDGSNAHDLVKPKVYERLIRKILQKRRAPAVVLMQLMPKGMAFAPGNKEKVPFAATLEDVYGAQAQYYDAPWLSFRNAMWRMAELHRGGFNWTDFMWDVDFMHPIDPGMRAICDAVVHLLQETALSLLLRPLDEADREMVREPLPPPMYPGNHEARNLACKYGLEFSPLVDAAGSGGWEFINEGGAKKPKQHAAHQVQLHA